MFSHAKDELILAEKLDDASGNFPNSCRILGVWCGVSKRLKAPPR